MYAIIKSGSRQYQVQPESVIEVNRLALEEGAAFETDQVLLFDNDGQDVQIGAPFVSGAKVKGKVLTHLRGRKIIVFKHKRRKNYRRTRGHRQELTQLLIEAIEVGGKTFGAPKKEKAEKPKAAAKPKATEEKDSEKKDTETKAEAKPKTTAKPKAEAKPTAREPDKATKKPAAKAGAKDTEEAAAKPKAAKPEAAKGKATESKAGKDK